MKNLLCGILAVTGAPSAFRAEGAFALKSGVALPADARPDTAGHFCISGKVHRQEFLLQGVAGIFRFVLYCQYQKLRRVIMKKTGGYIFVILSSIGFGLSPLLASFVTAYGVGSIMMTFMNTIFLVPLFLILCLAAKKPLSVSQKQLLDIFILALADSVLTTTFLFSSYQHLDGGTATSLNFTFPVFVLFL